MSLRSSSLKSKYILLQANKKEQGSGDGKPEGSKSPSCSGSDYGVDGKACSFFLRLVYHSPPPPPKKKVGGRGGGEKSLKQNLLLLSSSVLKRDQKVTKNGY